MKTIRQNSTGIEARLIQAMLNFHMTHNGQVTQVVKECQLYKDYVAKNNDGACDLNKATYSSDLCTQLLSLYGKEGNVVFDPFNGTGTTAISCVDLNMNYLGSEISADQCEYSIDRINKYIEERKE